MVSPTLFDGVVYEPTQTDSPGFDLTVDAIYEIHEAGRVDFGGGELEAAETRPHPSAKRNPDDEYEWWALDAGQYLIAYNESLATEDVTITVQPREELLARGASHPTLWLSSLERLPLSVGGDGIHIKENARVSTVIEADRTA